MRLKIAKYIGVASDSIGNVYDSDDFRRLNNPKPLFADSFDQLRSVDSFLFDDQEEYIYVAARYFNLYGTKLPFGAVKILKIHTLAGTVDVLWTLRLGNDRDVKKYFTTGQILLKTLIPDQFIVFKILSCNCGEGTECYPHGVPTTLVILNLNAKQEAILQETIGNIKLNTERMVFTYHSNSLLCHMALRWGKFITTVQSIEQKMSLP